MNCPRCAARGFRADHGFSGASGLRRQDGGSAAVAYNGMSCWCCGHWQEVGIESVMPDIPRDVRISQRDVVVKFFDSITKQVAAGATWYTIAHLLNQAGHRVQDKGLKKWFEIEQAERHGQAAKA